MDQNQNAIARQREAERAFAGCAFRNPEDALAKCGWLKPDLMLDIQAREFWRHLSNGSNGNVMDAGLKAGCLNDVIGWSNDIENAWYPESYAEEIVRRNYWVQFDPMLQEILRARRGMDYPAMRQAADKLAGLAPQEQAKLPDAMDGAMKFIEWMERDTKAIETHIPKIDRQLAGLDYQTLSILAARPSMGKTTLADQLARNVALSKKVCVFTNEMSLLQFWRKAACGACRIDYRAIKAGTLTEDQKQQLKDAAFHIAEQYGDRLLVDDRTHHTTQSIWQIVAHEKPALVVVDILAHLKDKHEREVQRLGMIVNSLRDMAKECNCHVMALHHINRGNEARENKVPTMSDLRESGNIEQDADYVFFLHSDKYYDTENPAKEHEVIPTDLWIAKDREGMRNVKIKLNFDPDQQWFEDRP